MTEREDALSDLGDAGVLDGLRWAWASAQRQTLRTYEPADGHDQGWVGYNAFKVFMDRLDRVFSCGRYAVLPDADPGDGADVVAEGLTSDEFSLMPRLAPDLVERDPLNGSPGWRYAEWRILLQSFGGLDVDHIPWSQKSQTKQLVASQSNPDQLMLPSEEVMALDVLANLPQYAAPDTPVVTLVGAYAIDVLTNDSMLYLGRPSPAGSGGAAWYWRTLLNGDGYEGGRTGSLRPNLPEDPSSQPVEDADVRLRSMPREGKREDEV